MAYRIERLKNSEIDEVLEWFSDRNEHFEGPAGFKAALSDLGFVVLDDAGNKCAVGWLYTTNSSVVYFEWAGTNPKLGLSGLHALKYLIESLKGWVKASDKYASILQFLPSEKLANFYEKHLGFKQTERATLVAWRK